MLPYFVSRNLYSLSITIIFDPDRWVSYQMDRQGFPLKVIHPTSNLLDLKYVLATKEEPDENNDGAPQRHRRRLLANFTTMIPPPPSLKQESRQRMHVQMHDVSNSSVHIGSHHDALDRLAQHPWETANNNDTLLLLRHRRLGSLTQITKKLNSDVTCALAWMNKHPNAYPSARAEHYYQSHPRPGQANIKRRVQQVDEENSLENRHLRDPKHLVVRGPEQLRPDHLRNLFPDQAFMNKRNPDHWIMGDHDPNSIQHKDADADRLERINQLVKEKRWALGNLS